jgi:hypothetical protein
VLRQFTFIVDKNIIFFGCPRFFSPIFDGADAGVLFSFTPCHLAQCSLFKRAEDFFGSLILRNICGVSPNQAAVKQVRMMLKHLHREGGLSGSFQYAVISPFQDIGFFMFASSKH